MSLQLREVAELIRNETGIVIRDNQLASLRAALSRIEPDMTAEDFLAGVSDPETGGQLLGLLVDEVTVQETYFFREDRALRAVDWSALLRAVHERGDDRVRVWVPACATGEEAYTLAMLAGDALGPGTVPVDILATDVSTAALAAARDGAYSKRSVRGIPAALGNRHLTSHGSIHRLGDDLRALVRFERHNLVTGGSPPLGESPFDLVVCRNVLIYFGPRAVESVLVSLEAALRPGAELILGAADRLTGTATRLASGPVEMDRRRPAAPKRKLRRPIGLEDSDRVARAAGPSPSEMPERAPDGADGPRLRLEDRIEDALLAADAGNLDQTIEMIDEVLSREPLHPDALFVRGIAELGRGDAAEAIVSLRRALYVEPSFGIAAFELGRAHDTLGQSAAAQRAYGRALGTLEPAVDRESPVLDRVDLGDVKSACLMRLGKDLKAAVG
jgi:chemotaxis protein methyltransferase CheR